MSTLDPKTIARLREAKQVVHVSGTASAIVDLADLRALLDTHAALEAAHTEALDVLEAMEFDHLDNSKCPVCRGWNMSSQGETPLAHTKDCTLATILAKAGRR